MSDEEPSRQVVEQRMRNRIIEYLEMVDKYEGDPPWDPNEVVNQWEDWVGVEHPVNVELFPAPTYVPREVAALRVVDAAWIEFAEATPQKATIERATLQLPEWREFVAASREALATLRVRGRLPED